MATFPTVKSRGVSQQTRDLPYDDSPHDITLLRGEKRKIKILGFAGESSVPDNVSRLPPVPPVPPATANRSSDEAVEARPNDAGRAGIPNPIGLPPRQTQPEMPNAMALRRSRPPDIQTPSSQLPMAGLNSKMAGMSVREKVFRGTPSHSQTTKSASTSSSSVAPWIACSPPLSAREQALLTQAMQSVSQAPPASSRPADLPAHLVQPGDPDRVRPDICRRMSKLMRAAEAVARTGGIPLSEAAELMRRSVLHTKAAGKLDAPAKARTVFDFYGIREEAAARQELAAVLGRHPDFQALDVSQAWRMSMDQPAWGDGSHEGLRFEDEPGYMAGMYRALAVMLEADMQDSPRKLDSKMYEHLHDVAGHGVVALKNDKDILSHLKEETLPLAAALTAPIPVKEREALLKQASSGLSLPEPLKSMHFISAGYTEKRSFFMMYPNRYMTEDGRRELLQRYGDDDADKPFRLIDRATRKSPSLTTPWASQSEIIVYNTMTTPGDKSAEEILQRCSEKTSEASTIDDKLHAIARCCQDLEQHHLFYDGNARTVGFLALNKLLLENGLKPCMFSDPNKFDGHSEAELVTLIKHGQEVFAHYAKPASRPSSDAT